MERDPGWFVCRSECANDHIHRGLALGFRERVRWRNDRFDPAGSRNLTTHADHISAQRIGRELNRYLPAGTVRLLI